MAADAGELDWSRFRANPYGPELRGRRRLARVTPGRLPEVVGYGRTCPAEAWNAVVAGGKGAGPGHPAKNGVRAATSSRARARRSGNARRGSSGAAYTQGMLTLKVPRRAGLRAAEDRLTPRAADARLAAPGHPAAPAATLTGTGPNSP
jgi:hypothetical protein